MIEKNVILNDSLAKTRLLRTRDYLLEMDIDKLVFYHEFEAGVINQFHEKEVELHGGWDGPLSHIRGTFTGHYLSAAANISQQLKCKQLELNVQQIINRMLACEAVNNDCWFFPIPEKYLKTLSTSAKFWAPQYVCQKNIMGLVDAYMYLNIEEALILIDKATNWFINFVDSMTREEMDYAMDHQETGAFLQTWCQIYNITKDERHLKLAYAYQRPNLTNAIAQNIDVLSDRHANTTIPEIHGIAELYNITKDPKYLTIVENYWNLAVTSRGVYVTGGSTSGEYWTRPNELFSRLSTTNQEHCTVYNMIWLAQYLYEWTHDTKYQDFIELNIYNGIFAQTFHRPHVHDCVCTDKNPQVLPVTYYLPMIADGQKKWGSKFDDFWCCHCTAVQANARIRELIYYKDNSNLYVNQYFESEYDDNESKISITQVDLQCEKYIEYNIKSQLKNKVMLYLRIPNWAKSFKVSNCKSYKQKDNYIQLAENVDLNIRFERQIEEVSIDNRTDIVGLRFGPVAIAAINETNPLYDEYEKLDYQKCRTESNWDVRFIDKNNTEYLPIHMIGTEKYTMYMRKG